MPVKLFAAALLLLGVACATVPPDGYERLQTQVTLLREQLGRLEADLADLTSKVALIESAPPADAVCLPEDRE